MSLTERGRELIPKAVDLISIARDLKLPELEGAAELPLKIGAIEPVGSHYLPKVLGAYQRYRRFPVSFELHGGTTTSLTRAIREGSVSFALVARPARTVGLTFLPLFEESVALLVPKTHVLAREKNVTVRRLSDERLILTDDGCDFRTVLQREFDRLYCSPERVTTASTIEGIVEAVRAGLGLAILPRCGINPVPSGTRVVPIHKSNLTLCIGICARQSLREREAKRALEFVAKTLKST